MWHPYNATASSQNLAPIRLLYGPLGQQREASFGLRARDAETEAAFLRTFRNRLTTHADSIDLSAPVTIPSRGMVLPSIETPGFEFVLSAAEADAVDAAVIKVGASIGLAQSNPLIVNADVNINPFEPGLQTVSSLGFAIADLLTLWDQRFREQTPEIIVKEKKRVGWIVAGSIAFALLGIGSIAWIASRDVKPRRRRRR